MSNVSILVVVAVGLGVFLVLMGIGFMAVAAYFWEKRTSTNRRYDLIERGLDRDPKAGLREINEALRYIDGDRRGNHSEGRHVRHAGVQRPPLLIDDNGFPSSDAVPPSLPMRTKRAS